MLLHGGDASRLPTAGVRRRAARLSQEGFRDSVRGGPRPRQPDQLCDFRGRQVVLAQRHPGIGALDKFWAVAIGCAAGRAAGASSPAGVVDAGEVSAPAAAGHRSDGAGIVAH